MRSVLETNASITLHTPCCCTCGVVRCLCPLCLSGLRGPFGCLALSISWTVSCRAGSRARRRRQGRRDCADQELGEFWRHWAGKCVARGLGQHCAGMRGAAVGQGYSVGSLSPSSQCAAFELKPASWLLRVLTCGASGSLLFAVVLAGNVAVRRPACFQRVCMRGMRFELGPGPGVGMHSTAAAGSMPAA
jgi:hypothetical protein